MDDLPELQRRLLQRSRLLGFEPWSDSPLRQTGDRSSPDSDSSGDDIDCEGTACAGSRHRYTNPTTSRARASPDHQPPEPDRLGHTGWCTCGRCVPMPTALESVCCREVPAATRKQPSDCLTTHPHFHTLCLDEVVLDVAIHMLQDRGIRVENTRLLDVNATRRGAESTVETLTSVRETRNEQQARIKELSTANDKLQAHVERLQAKMQRPIQAVSLTKASDVPDDTATALSNCPAVQRLEPSNIPARPTPTQRNIVALEVPLQTSTPHENNTKSPISLG
ncbi:hypothetical protein HPB47_016372 [Ixodes persulcatus]|uniref:Uncharacterized protein n=1 Tax=Ixodes persulcatus TaxID=34615 RepID=A0AC60QTJ4_IXOPE|nr:hypothetical protein HPB47_016372 [Ixodes persulcatus]